MKETPKQVVNLEEVKQSKTKQKIKQTASAIYLLKGFSDQIDRMNRNNVITEVELKQLLQIKRAITERYIG